MHGYSILLPIRTLRHMCAVGFGMNSVVLQQVAIHMCGCREQAGFDFLAAVNMEVRRDTFLLIAEDLRLAMDTRTRLVICS